MITWKKLGKIFDPSQHLLPNECREYAQSPQAIVLKDRIRIYFSTRQIDKSCGKFLSHVAYVDFDQRMEKILDISKDTVIALGELGCFDEHGIFPFSPFQDQERIISYTCGWSRRKSVSVETSTGYAESHDGGKTFQKLGNGPVFGPTLHQPFLVGDSYVRKFQDCYHMWYIYGEKWVRESPESAPDRVYKIGHATSNDGINWLPENRQIIRDKLHINECQALPSVFFHGGLYHMYFCYRDVFGFRDDRSKAYRIGYAYSVDLKNWARNDKISGIEISEDMEEWDSEMMCYPHVVQGCQQTYLLYNGNHFGRYGFGAAVIQDHIEYKTNFADLDEMQNHFMRCNPDFLRWLQIRVDVDVYLRKIIEKSTRYEAWHNGRLVGLLAAYHNDEECGFDYITTLSIESSFEKKGVATCLLSHIQAFTKNREVRLEVHNENKTAYQFYLNRGFRKIGDGNTKGYVLLSLRKDF